MQCVICGKEIEKSMYGNAILCSDECFHIHFWDTIAAHRESYVIINGVSYRPCNEKDRGFRGFGGREFIFQNLKTGEVQTSTNLWCQGTIPASHRDILKDTHIFL